MLDYTIWDNSVRQWLIAGAILILTWIAVRIIGYVSRRWLRPLVERTNNRADNIIYRATEAPLRFGVALLGVWIAIHTLVYPDSWVRYVDMAFRILIVLDITWLVARLGEEALLLYWRRKEDVQLNLLPVVRRGVLVVVWIVGVVTALSNVGIDISALWGTLGIGGIALALAAQDTVKNVLGAITIFADRPFGIGDTININGYEGTVVDIGMRSTRLRGYDGRITSYPNYRITEAAILNISTEPRRRVEVLLRLSPDSPPSKILEAIAILQALPLSMEHLSDREGDTSAYFTHWGEWAFEITLYYHILSGSNIMRTISDVNIRILSEFLSHDIRLALPLRQVVMDSQAEEWNRGTDFAED